MESSLEIHKSFLGRKGLLRIRKSTWKTRSPATCQISSKFPHEDPAFATFQPISWSKNRLRFLDPAFSLKNVSPFKLFDENTFSSIGAIAICRFSLDGHSSYSEVEFAVGLSRLKSSDCNQS